MESKEKIRNMIWKLMEERKIADFPLPCYGRIPNFVGSFIACERIKKLPEFQTAKCVFCAPDYVLKRVREIVLEEGKILAIALPHMKGFLEIRERIHIKKATTIKGFKKYGIPLKTKVDLFIQGSVAVDKRGNRLGKGKGYGDKEWDWLENHNLIDSKAKIVTIVHDIQILDDFSSLITKKDKSVDYILTPQRIIKIKD
jgi:5-formyltetrahydrofolate cyclo-ligase